jgi:hypothetical protein
MPKSKMENQRTVAEIRDAVEFLERLTIFKTNRHKNLSSGFEPIIRLPRESFVNYALRVKAAFPPDHKLPRLRMRKYRG